MRRTRCERRSGSSSEKTSSSRSSGGRPSSAVTTSSSASLRARIAVRCWPREANVGEVAAAELEDEVVAVRPDERRAVPDLLLGRLGQAPGERVARRLAGEWRRVRLVAQRQARRRRPPPGRSRRGPPPAARPATSSSRRRSATIAAAGVEERAVPEAQLVARRALLADRPQQAVALLERPAVRRRGRRRRPASRSRPAGRATARRSDGEPAISSISSGAKRTTRRSPARPAARRPSPLTRIRLRPAVPVAPARTIGDLDACRARPSPRPGRGRVPQRMSSPSVVVRCDRPQAEQDHRLEEARLAGRVRAPTRCGPGPNVASSDA